METTSEEIDYTPFLKETLRVMQEKNPNDGEYFWKIFRDFSRNLVAQGKPRPEATF